MPSVVNFVLALDLERTLVDDARSAQPRPGLAAFLAWCHERFPRVALFTTVDEADAREVMEQLAERGHAPRGLIERLEYVAWRGAWKDLALIEGEAVLVDDDEGWIAPYQRERWVRIAPWDGGADAELERVRAVLERRAAAS